MFKVRKRYGGDIQEESLPKMRPQSKPSTLDLKREGKTQ
jgi:hypothetical protein